MVNSVVLIGRLTRDPEFRRTNNGNGVCNFTLAIERPSSKDREKQVDFIPCAVWNKTAENVEKYCSKGSKVAVTGCIQSSTYQTNEGNRTSISVLGNTVEFLSVKSEASNNPSIQNYENSSTPTQYQNNFYDTQKVDLEAEFSNNDEVDFEIEMDDLQF